ncbi:hypothetical protein TanjilG_20117 [Lupinus angustifolius]|uniref:RING-type E3 ubiquitin transferase n=1 Tax=Lupinus angustifolius TaxID=3871 RepID=A0A4P1RCN3_LUPAN|nr:PREDICTED: E3 ubiquitin-protein ligase ATL6-like [Lupinus angustifolius]OIW08016.1 hypothetical protein TanjilG_20117 [Lupinus angustifolius]
MVQPNHFSTHTTCHLSLIFFPLLLLLHVADAQISAEPVPTYISHHTWQPSFAITTGAIIFALLILGLISIYIRNCTNSRYNPRTNNTLVGTTNTSQRPCSCSQGITNELLNTFPILFYSTIKDLKMGKGSLECAVCLNDFKDYDTLRLLPKCNHVFHPSCIDSWLCSQVTCPVCRANLNQDSCEVSMTVETQLSNPQRVSESPGFIADHFGGEEHYNNNPIEQNTNQVAINLKESEGNNDLGSLKMKHLRSNSTGHSVLESGKSVERYTLTLPEDVRKYILVNHNNHGRRVQRSASYNNVVMMPMLESPRKCWSDIEGNNKLRVLLTPQFVASRG